MITHLNEKLIAVEVPSDHETKISILNWLCFRHKKEKIWHPVFKLDGNWKILGEVDADTISFDVELPNHGMLNNKYAFRSLLQSKGIDTNKPNVKHVILEKV